MNELKQLVDMLVLVGKEELVDEHDVCQILWPTSNGPGRGVTWCLSLAIYWN